MTRNEKSLQALFNSNEPGWCFIFGTDKASVFEKDGRYMVEYSYGNQVSDPEYFDDEETAKEYAIDLSQSRRPIKSDVIIKFEYKDKKYGNPNVKYTQTAIYPSVNEFKKIMDENNTEFKIIRVTPLK